ncbi:MAG: MFS transporter [Oscillospiraceae bacterium]|nr:MFS transporter [Oscillospiraceae bacterium]
MEQKKGISLKIALLSTCFVTASINAITANIPEMTKSFPDVPLYVIELLTTVPSLFQMLGVLCGGLIAKRLGYKGTLLLGLFCCGVGGVIPVFFPRFGVILVTRCVYGIGCGFTTSMLLTLLIHFFDGSARSTMIGLNGGISGLGSALTAFAAGQLLSFGWNVSFTVYLVAVPAIVLFAVIVPDVRGTAGVPKEKAATGRRGGFAGLARLGLLMFLSVLLATMYVIKASTLITESGFGTAREGSYAITAISLGSFSAGLTYGPLRAKLGKYSLALFYAVCLAGFLLGGLARGLVLVLAGAFALGYGYLGFVPFIQEQVSRDFAAYGETATNLILILQSLGAFAAPYLGNLFRLISEGLRTQFFLCAGCCAVLAVFAALMQENGKAAVPTRAE